MGLRLIVLAFAVFALVWGVRLLWRRPHLPREGPPRRVGRMVRCEHCGLHVPREEAVSSGDHHYCSEDHRRADEAKEK